jgi:hypothetical protein
MEASLHPDGGYYALKDGEAPAQSMRSKNLRHVELLLPPRFFAILRGSGKRRNHFEIRFDEHTRSATIHGLA